MLRVYSFQADQVPGMFHQTLPKAPRGAEDSALMQTLKHHVIPNLTPSVVRGQISVAQPMSRASIRSVFGGLMQVLASRRHISGRPKGCQPRRAGARGLSK